MEITAALLKEHDTPFTIETIELDTDLRPEERNNAKGNIEDATVTG